MKAGRFSKGSLSLVPAVWGRDRDSKHWGQANADRTSAAALMASFTGTLIGPLMSLEKVVKAMKMESVPLCWHAIISLCVYLWITTFSPFLCAPRECPILPLHYSSYSLSFTVSSLAVSLSFIQHVVLLLVCIVALLQSSLFSPSQTLIAVLKLQQMAIMTVCIFIISFYLPFR